jgi:hypothetical protein
LPENRKGKTFDITQERVTLVPRFHEAPISARLSSDGSFTLGPGDIGDYELGPDFRAPLYVRAVRLNGTDIHGRYFRISAESPANLEVEVSGDGDKIDFRVAPDSSLPMPEPHLTEVCRNSPIFSVNGADVVLLPEPLFTDGSNPASSLEKRVLRATHVGDGNRTWPQISGVPPGEYRALAAEHLFDVFHFANLHDVTSDERASLEALAGLGQPVTVGPNSTQEFTLPDRTIDFARLAAKIGLAFNAAVLGAR